MRSAVVLLLIGLTAAVYWPVWHYGFVRFDDPAVVSENPHVAGGLTAADARWAVTGFAVGHWEPLTWWSLQADVSLWHGRAGPMHVENAALHAVGSIVLFGLLTSATGAVGRSAVVAMLFAVHPVHVESVAWVTERRDVLSTPLLLAAVWAYVRHARRPSASAYAGFVGLYALSLSAKATGITLPFVLVLVDRWPLQRGWRVWDKALPLAMAGATAWLAMAAQRAVGAASSLAQVGVGDRLSNAVVVPILYVSKLLVPVGLSPLYPYVVRRMGLVIGAFAILAVVTAVTWRQRVRRPYLLVGWGWFLVTLLPTSGLAQSGPQAMADRYAYVPSVGLTVALVWLLAEVPAAPAWATASVVTMAVVARAQVRYWADTASLHGRILAMTEGFAGAHVQFGADAAAAGDVAAAEREFAAALADAPRDADALFYLGNLRLNVERNPAAAADCYRRAAAVHPGSSAVECNWGVALLQLRRPADAYPHLRAATRFDPDAFDPHYNLGELLLNVDPAAAAVEFADAVRIDPASARARDRLAAARRVH